MPRLFSSRCSAFSVFVRSFSHSRSASNATSPAAASHPRLVFSGIQPTGTLHLGNYLGAISTWLGLQSSESAAGRRIYLSIVDLHALTVRQQPSTLTDNTYSMAASLLACGITPSQSCLFVQSCSRSHSELQWLLGCLMPHNWLNNQTQYKDKAKKLSSSHQTISFGLYAYPLLQAADILLYRGTHVPVGQDQYQQLELARSIAQLFNHTYQTEYFPLPETLISHFPKVMSLKSASQKMSKSDPHDKNRINLNDSDEEIRKKIRGATTDSNVGLEPDTCSAETRNLVDLLAFLSGRTQQQIFAEPKYKQSKLHLKEELAEALVAKLGPIRTEYNKLMSDRSHLQSVLQSGAREANEQAERTIKEVKLIMGIADI